MDKKTIAAVGLIILVIGVYNLFIIPKFSPPPPPEKAGAPTAQTAAPAASPSPAPATNAAPAAPGAALATAPAAEPVASAAPEAVAVDRPLWNATFSNVGGGLESWRLKSYTYAKGAKDAADASIGGTPLEIVRPGSAALPLSFVFTDAATQAAFARPQLVQRTPTGFTLAGADAGGLRLTRTYSFDPGGYRGDVLITLENAGETPRAVSWEMAFGPGVDRHLPESAKNDEGVTYLAGSNRDSVKVKKVGEAKELGPVSWVAVGNRYFVAALLPLEGSLSAFARRTTPAGEEIGVHSQLAALGPRQSVTYRVAMYLGPKDRKVLAAAAKGLELTVDYGWFWWLAIPFLGILQFCYGFLRSYGLAILALTFLVKAALFPVSFKMFRSMKKMQELQPKMAALKAKFKSDNQGLQQATMALYREHKVNPMAGCLPMVVQIPVFFALYKVLYNAIELRGAGFLYIPDLSLKDPYYITPILMGVTMLIQQRMTPTAGDPAQAKMMMFMPVIMTAMFINFSSGLVLYFLFSNLLSIAEQKVFRVLGARGQAATAAVVDEAGGTGKKKRLPRA